MERVKLTGAEIIVKSLIEQGVDTVFGYPGGKVLDTYDALYRHSDQIKHILTSHEQGASFAADGYARATGKVGVCMSTSGPGATNLVTGIANAQMDSVPLVAITGNVPLSILGKDSFQEVDIAGVTMPITKHNFIVTKVEELAQTIADAFYIAAEGRPGAVLVDIPQNIATATCEYVPAPKRPITPSVEHITAEDLEKAVEMIKAASKPMILTGGGTAIAGAEAELAEFVKKVHAPVADTLMGKGTFDTEDPLYSGMCGMHGTKASNTGISRCDLLIVIGSRFSDRVTSNAGTFARKSKILQFDIDPAEVNKNILVHHNVIGDIKEILKRLNPLLPQLDHTAWVNEIAGIKEKYPLSYSDDTLTAQYVMERLSALTKNDALVVTEVGQHQMWAAQFYKFKFHRQMITSGGLGSMGYGLGAAIGAAFGRDDKKIVNIAGDGCFRMNCNELATVRGYDLPIVEIIINNRVLGMVRQWQTLFYGERYSNTNLSDTIDYMKMAEAFGIKGLEIREKSEVDKVLSEALAESGPVIVNVVIGENNMVSPMVAPGGSIDKELELKN